MTKEDLSQLVTLKDLEDFRKRMINDIKELLINQATSGRKFFTQKEFCHLTGFKYSTVAYRCKVGRLKARQDGPNCSWQIDVSEIERLKGEALENVN